MSDHLIIIILMIIMIVKDHQVIMIIFSGTALAVAAEARKYLNIKL